MIKAEDIIIEGTTARTAATVTRVVDALNEMAAADARRDQFLANNADEIRAAAAATRARRAAERAARMAR